MFYQNPGLKERTCRCKLCRKQLDSNSMQKHDSYNLLVILGATASGKTATAVRVARELEGEILSADSRQVFRGMDIGTGKDLDEFGEVRHHLIDICDAGDEFSLFAFQQVFHQAFASVQAEGHLPMLVGGTGLYLDCAIRNYPLLDVAPDAELRAELADISMEELRRELHRLKPQQHNTTDLQQRERLVRAIEIARAEQDSSGRVPPLPEVRPLVFGLRWERPVLRNRIARRLRERLEQGMVEEVEQLHAAGVSWERLDYYGLEYRFLGRYLRREISRNDLVQQLEAAIGQFAKRQETFFRRMERQGTAIHWLPGEREPAKALLDWLRSERLVRRNGCLVPTGETE